MDRMGREGPPNVEHFSSIKSDLARKSNPKSEKGNVDVIKKSGNTADYVVRKCPFRKFASNQEFIFFEP